MEPWAPRPDPQTGGLRGGVAEDFPNGGGNRAFLFVAGERYRGQHGDSLRLEGLEAGFNDQARARAIVIHGADYATPEFAQKNGRLGLSWGCPAVAPALVAPLIDALEAGGVLLAWYPDPTWLSASAYVK